MGQRTFTVRQAIEFLDIDLPKIKPGMSQRDVDKLANDWKEHELKTRYRERVREEHPDLHDNSPESNQMVMDLRSAYDKIRFHLKMRKPPPKAPKPSEVTHCPRCSALRKPKDAFHCHECGAPYKQEIPRSRCPACDAKRVPMGAKFCHFCGYDYKVPDSLHEVLRAKGVKESVIQKMEREGMLEGLRNMNPLSPEFQRLVNLFDRGMV